MYQDPNTIVTKQEEKISHTELNPYDSTDPLIILKQLIEDSGYSGSLDAQEILSSVKKTDVNEPDLFSVSSDTTGQPPEQLTVKIIAEPQVPEKLIERIESTPQKEPENIETHQTFLEESPLSDSTLLKEKDDVMKGAIAAFKEFIQTENDFCRDIKEAGQILSAAKNKGYFEKLENTTLKDLAGKEITLTSQEFMGKIKFYYEQLAFNPFVSIDSDDISNENFKFALDKLIQTLENKGISFHKTTLTDIDNLEQPLFVRRFKLLCQLSYYYNTTREYLDATEKSVRQTIENEKNPPFTWVNLFKKPPAPSPERLRELENIEKWLTKSFNTELRGTAIIKPVQRLTRWQMTLTELENKLIQVEKETAGKYGTEELKILQPFLKVIKETTTKANDYIKTAEKQISAWEKDKNPTIENFLKKQPAKRMKNILAESTSLDRLNHNGHFNRRIISLTNQPPKEQLSDESSSPRFETTLRISSGPNDQ